LPLTLVVALVVFFGISEVRASGTEEVEEHPKAMDNRASGMDRRGQQIQSRHAKRLELLSKIAAIGEEKGNESLTQRAQALMKKENEKYNKHMARLEAQSEKAAK
jgi:hypothetical protein